MDCRLPLPWLHKVEGVDGLPPSPEAHRPTDRSPDRPPTALADRPPRGGALPRLADGHLQRLSRAIGRLAQHDLLLDAQARRPIFLCEFFPSAATILPHANAAQG